MGKSRYSLASRRMCRHATSWPSVRQSRRTTRPRFQVAMMSAMTLLATSPTAPKASDPDPSCSPLDETLRTTWEAEVCLKALDRTHQAWKDWLTPDMQVAATSKPKAHNP